MIRSLLGTRIRTEDPYDFNDPRHPRWYTDASGFTVAADGPMLSPERAMREATVYSCVRILAETVASLPLHLYRRRADGGKERATSHPLYEVLHDFPNAWQTMVEFLEQTMYHVTLRGNGLAEIKPGSTGSVSQLLPIKPQLIKEPPERMPNGELKYIVFDEESSKERVLFSGDLLHIRAMSSDGLWGLTPITHASTVIGTALASDEMEINQLKKGQRPSGTYKHPGKLSDKAYGRLKVQMSETAGVTGAGKTLILEEGMEWKPVSMTNRDAQFIDSKKLRPSQIARIFRIPPHMIGDHEKGATYSSVEQQALDFVVHTIRPWLVRIEKAIKRDLISQTGTFFAEFLVDALLRGDQASRYNAYAIGIQNEILNPNEVRGFENLNPYEGGDEYRNRITQPEKEMAGEDEGGRRGGESAGSDGDDEQGDEQSAAARLLDVFARDVAGRIAAAELSELRKRVKHATADNGKFREWVAGYYEQHARYVDKAIGPICDGLEVRECDRVAFVEGITRANARTIAESNGDAERIVESWDKGELAEQYVNQIRKLAV